MRIAVVGAGLRRPRLRRRSRARRRRRHGVRGAAIASAAACGRTSMPDGARFERGGEFVEAGYDHMRRRPRSTACALVPQGFAVRRARGAIRRADAAHAAARGRAGRSARPSTRSARTRPRISAADALVRTPLEPLARRALQSGSRGRTRWSSTASRRPGSRAPSCGAAEPRRQALGAPGRRQRRPGEGDGGRARAIACGSAGGRVAAATPSDGVALAAAGAGEHFDRAVLAVPLSVLRDRLLPALRERASYERLQWGAAAKLHVPLAEPAAPGAVQGLDAAFWTWTARGPGGAPATIAASFAGGRRGDRDARDRTWHGNAGARPCRSCVPSSPWASRQCSRAGATTRTATARTPVIRPGGRRGTTRRSRRRTAESTSPGSTRRPSSAERWKARCAAALVQPPRCSRARASQRLTYVRSAIYTGDWLTGAGKPSIRAIGPDGTGSQLLGAVVVPFRRDITLGRGGEPDRHAASCLARNQPRGGRGRGRRPGDDLGCAAHGLCDEAVLDRGLQSTELEPHQLDAAGAAQRPEAVVGEEVAREDGAVVQEALGELRLGGVHERERLDRRAARARGRRRCRRGTGSAATTGWTGRRDTRRSRARRRPRPARREACGHAETPAPVRTAARPRAARRRRRPLPRRRIRPRRPGSIAACRWPAGPVSATTRTCGTPPACAARWLRSGAGSPSPGQLRSST